MDPMFDLEFRSIMNHRREILKKLGLSLAALPLWSGSVAQDVLQNKEPEEGLWLEVLKYARWSPSPHNIQPWKLRIDSNRKATLCYDPKRLIPYTDPDNRFMLMGLAIFVEYLSIAARPHGFSVKPVYREAFLDHTNSTVTPCATLTFVPDNTPAQNRELILQRRTSRLPYNHEPVAHTAMTEFQKLSRSYHHKLEYSHAKDMADWVIKLNRDTLFEDLTDEGVREELKLWLRYSKKQAAHQKDGLWSRCMRFPGWFMKSFFNHPEKYDEGLKRRLLEKRYIQKMRGSETVMWISGPFKTFQDWINAGQLLGQLWLKATEHQVYMHPFGSVITNTRAHAQLDKHVSFRSGHSEIWFLARLGYGDTPPGSYRLDINDILI